MRLAHPYFLLLLLLVPVLVGLRNFYQRRRTMQFSNAEVLKGLPRSWRIYLQPLLPMLFASGLVCLMVALARPQKGLDNSRVHTEGVDIMLLLDLSESMNTPDFLSDRGPMTRLDASKAVIERFLSRRSDDRIGMVAFASLPYAVAPLTLDHPWLKERMKGLHTRMLDGRSTAIGDGMASAINHIRDSQAKSKVIILLTDGANNSGALSPENAADLAKTLGVKIYTIGAGRSDGEVDVKTLQNIAEVTGAKFYRARSLSSLDAVYREIDQLEKTEIEVELYTRYEEKAHLWIVAGILLLGVEQILGLTKLGRVP